MAGVSRGEGGVPIRHRSQLDPADAVRPGLKV